MTTTNLSVFSDLAGHVGGGRGDDGLFWNELGRGGERRERKGRDRVLSFFFFFFRSCRFHLLVSPTPPPTTTTTATKGALSLWLSRAHSNPTASVDLSYSPVHLGRSSRFMQKRRNARPGARTGQQPTGKWGGMQDFQNNQIDFSTTRARKTRTGKQSIIGLLHPRHRAASQGVRGFLPAPQGLVPRELEPTRVREENSRGEAKPDVRANGEIERNKIASSNEKTFFETIEITKDSR